VDFEGMGHAWFCNKISLSGSHQLLIFWQNLWQQEKKKKGSANLLFLGENGPKPSEEICLEIAMFRQ
jgi:hypothetical protein